MSGCEACTTDVDLVGSIKASGAVGQPVAFDLTGAGWNSPSVLGLCPTVVRVYDNSNRILEEHPIDAVRRGENDCDVAGPGTRFTVDAPETAVAGTVRLTVELYRLIEGHVPGVGQTTENNRVAIRARREVAVDIASSPPGQHAAHRGLHRHARLTVGRARRPARLGSLERRRGADRRPRVGPRRRRLVRDGGGSADADDPVRPARAHASWGSASSTRRVRWGR